MEYVRNLLNEAIFVVCQLRLLLQWRMWWTTSSSQENSLAIHTLHVGHCLHTPFLAGWESPGRVHDLKIKDIKDLRSWPHAQVLLQRDSVARRTHNMHGESASLQSVSSDNSCTSIFTLLSFSHSKIPPHMAWYDLAALTAKLWQMPLIHYYHLQRASVFWARNWFTVANPFGGDVALTRSKRSLGHLY